MGLASENTSRIIKAAWGWGWGFRPPDLPLESGVCKTSRATIPGSGSQNRDASAATLTAVPACQHPGSWEGTREPAQRVPIASRPCSSAEKRKEQRGHGLHALSHFQSSWKIMQLADSNSHADPGRRKCGHVAVAIPPTRPRAAARPTSRFLFLFLFLTKPNFGV